VIDLLVISPASFTAVNRAVYRELAARGLTVELVIPEARAFAGGVRAPQPAAPDDPPLHLLAPSSKNERLARYPGLWRLLEARRPRVVLLEGDPQSRTAVEVGLWARLRRGHLVCQSYENLSRRLLPSYRRNGLQGLAAASVVHALKLAARPNVDHVLVVSADGERVLREQGFRAITKIPLGFDPTLFRPDPAARAEVRARLGLTGVTVAYFGRVTAAKGVHLLVEALAGLRAEPWTLLLDAFSNYREPYEQRVQALIAEHGLEERVVRFDASHTEIAAYMNAADIVVLPSVSTPRWIEQYGRVIPEAMACGAAVIASRSGTLPELVGDAGVLVPEGDVSALRAALAALLADPDRRAALGAAATARAHAELDLRRQATLVEGLVRELSAS